MYSRIILASSLFLLTPPMVYAQGTSTANVGWYNGDCQQAIPGEANWYVSDQQFSQTFDNFVVPSGGWTVAGMFSQNSMTVSGVTEAVWEIRSGVSAGNGGTVITSGQSPATQTLLYTLPNGENFYRVEVDGLEAQLAPGAYWISVSPVLAVETSAPSFVCATLGANATGNPPYLIEYALAGSPLQRARCD